MWRAHTHKKKKNEEERRRQSVKQNEGQSREGGTSFSIEIVSPACILKQTNKQKTYSKQQQQQQQKEEILIQGEGCKKRHLPRPHACR